MPGPCDGLCKGGVNVAGLHAELYKDTKKLIEEKMSLLSDGLLKCGISSDLLENLEAKMETYIGEISLFNSAYNLTNTSDHDELVTRHILDSLAAYPVIKNLIEEMEKGSLEQDVGHHLAENVPQSANSPRSEATPSLLLADIGSGGGLPGIPLAAAFPQVKFNLVERMQKRCNFLENCIAILGLKNVEVICSEAEKIPEQKYDLITFRAFRPLDKEMTKTLLKMVKNGGFLCAYKAKMDSITEEMNGIKNLVPEYKVEKLTVPGLEDSERNLVIIKK